MKRGFDVASCKPVGQEFLEIEDLSVDKDTVLFADLIHFDPDPREHRPIIIGSGATTEMIDSPERFNPEATIQEAARLLRSHKEFIIYEGTGHPGVGSVAEVSNARVARILEAGLIMVVEGGIGSTIDQLNLCLSLFREEQVPVIGIIINKVLPEKLDKVQHYVGKWLRHHDLKLLGVIPYDRTMAYPVMKAVTDAIDGVVTHNQDMLYNKVEDILAGSLIDLKELKTFSDLLLVVSVRSLDGAINKIRSICEMMDKDDAPLSGIVATGVGTPGRESLDYIEQHRIPLIRTSLDTYGSVIKISRIEVKINRNTPWKVQRAIELVAQNVDVDAILDQL
jgi:dethiobiotin synthetase